MPKLDAKFVSKVQPPSAGRKIHWDNTLKGFGILVMASGHKSFVFQYRVAGKLRRMTLDADSVDTGRTQAEVLKGRIATGRLLNQPSDPLADRRREVAIKSGRGTFEDVATNWYKDEGKNIRSGKKRFGYMERLVFPWIGDTQVDDIKRPDIVRLIESIKTNNGPGMAVCTLGAVRRAFSWYEARDESFRSPIHREMRKIAGKVNRRQRTLNDRELRIIWFAAQADKGPFGALLRFVLLTAARRLEATGMRRSELTGNDWTVPAIRYKTGIDHVVPLSAAVRAIVDRLPRLGNGDLVFTVAGKIPIGGISDRKAAFDETILNMMREDDPLAEPLPNWTVHDLRRTARTLMGRARVPTDIAERCLGHVKTGERGTYDCWAYLEEKREAFEALAALIKSIVGLH